ncbi:hypothetical protein [Kitasatospora sp. NPDC101183]|uniref:hypothetical protein n=1 Tax=Kitasatospora sp. NPDC101183 TaxID=3364100 RepID=UPI00381AFB7D
MTATPIMKKYRFSMRMVDVLLSGESADGAHGRTGTLVALIDRQMITAATSETGGRHLLTEKGREVLAELRAAAQPDDHACVADGEGRDAAALTHIRTENGVTALVTTRAALDEINAGMMRPTKKLVRQMSARGASASLEYFDGRKVSICPATPEEIEALSAKAQPTALATEYRTLKGAKIGDTLTLWERGGKKGPTGTPTTVTIAEIRGGWYVTSPGSDRARFLGGTGSKYWVVVA